MKIVAWFLLQIAFMLLAVLWAGRTTMGRIGSACLLLLALLLPVVASIGPLPKALLAHCLQQGWMRRYASERALEVTPLGRKHLAGLLPSVNAL